MQAAKKIVFGMLLATAAQASTAQPTCNNMVGAWVNELGSTLNIASIDPANNMVSGTYSSPSGTSGQTFPLVGWVNHQSPVPSGNNAYVISFSVQWGQYGSITSWTGTCTNASGAPTMKTQWNLARSNSQFDWDHIISNSDTFTPQ